MDYTLQELSNKLGIPEFPERREMLYYYNDENNTRLGGHGEIRLEDSSRLFTANLYHARKDYIDDEGVEHKLYEETMQIQACRMGNGDIFRIVHIEIDGKEQSPTDPAVVELGFAIFHSRIVDINFGMVKQSFGLLDEKRENKAVKKLDTSVFEKSQGVVIPFPSKKKHGLAI